MFRKSPFSSEEFVFYIDLISNFIKKKNLIKLFNTFSKEKSKYHANISYGIIMFQESEKLINIYNSPNIETITAVIDKYWDNREKSKSYFEKGLFEILAHLFKASKGENKAYRIIVLSDTPSELDRDYQDALYDLIIKAKHFNIFIDVIRFGTEKFYSDEVKLKVITSETRGGVFYCNDPKTFLNILLSLVQSKTEEVLVAPDSEEEIKEEDKLFYERLAAELISLDPEDEEICGICNKEICPICETHADIIHKCYNCGAKYHSCCAAKYAINNNIGLKHIFRCIKCDTLLKLDEDFVSMIYQEEFAPEIEKEAISKEQLQGQEIESESVESSTGVEQHLEGLTEKISPEKEIIEENGIQRVIPSGYFGPKIIIKSPTSKEAVVNEVSKTLEVIEERESKRISKETLSITSLKPPPKKGSIKLCNICGETVRNASICPNCGARLD